jgi:hypothetical protein
VLIHYDAGIVQSAGEEPPPEEPKRPSITVIGRDVVSAIASAGLFFVLAAPRVAAAPVVEAKKPAIVIVDGRAEAKRQVGLFLLVKTPPAPPVAPEVRRVVPITIITGDVDSRKEAVVLIVKSPPSAAAPVTSARATQIIAEVVIGGGDTRATQLVAEIIIGNANAIITQLIAEILVESAPVQGIFITQLWLELILAVTDELEYIEEVHCTGFPTHTVETCPEDTIHVEEAKPSTTHVTEVEPSTSYTEEAKPSPFSGSNEPSC